MIATSSVSVINVNDGATGAQGVSITGEKEQWYLSSSKTQLSGGSWSYTEPQTIPDGKYLWGRWEMTMSNGTKQYSDAVYRSVIGGIKDIVDEDHLSITQKVWQSDITNSINSYDGSTVAAVRDRVTQTETDISGITTRVSDVESETDSLGTRMTSAESSITQNANKIGLMVSVDGTSSSLTLTQNMLSAMTNQFVIKDPAGSATIISGGKIHANAITTNMLAANAIKSTNYSSGTQTDVPSGHYSNTGTFLDLTTGNIYTPNFAVNSVNGEAYLNGTIYATSGRIGEDEDNSSYWEIGTNYDSSWNSKAALIAHGNSLIQTGKFTLSNDRLNSLNGGNYIQVTDGTTNYWYDFGIQVPDKNATGSIDGYNGHKKNFLYIRRTTSKPTESTLDSDWTYLFRVDDNGDIYWNGHNISDGTYLPLSGGTLTGALTVPTLTVTGTLTGTASAANKLASAKTIRTNLASTSTASFDGTANITPGVTGTLGVGNGGTGKSSWTQWGIVYASATNALSQIGAGTSGQVLTSNGSAAPAWTNQSALSVGSATKATQDSDGNAINTTYRKLTNDLFETINVTDISVGNMVVTGAARFTNGLYGTLTGNVVGNISGSAGSVTNNLKIQLNGGTTEGTNQFTYNGSAAKNINITKSSIGLSNVDNTADANKAVLTATKFASAQSVTLTGDTTGTASSQAGWSIATTTKKLTNSGRLTSANVDNSSANYLNKITYFLASSSMTEGKPPSDGGILNFAWDQRKWGAQLAIRIDTTPHLYLRGNNNSAWDTNWLTVLDSNNYNSYSPKLDGTGATGTWGISVTGNAATATKLTGTTGSWSEPVYINDGVPTKIDYLNIHPENANKIIIPFFNNELGYLTRRGGSCEIYSTTSTSFTGLTLDKTVLNIDMNNAFNGSYNYCNLNRPQDETTVIDITCPEKFTYTNMFYIDFGSSSWRAKNIEFYVMNSATQTSYTRKSYISNQDKGHWLVNFSHTSTNSSGTTVQGYNMIRIVLSGWAGTQSRIAQIGIVPYNSIGGRRLFMSLGNDDPVYRSITPGINDTYTLGSSTNKWHYMYATTFYGALSGNASSATKLGTARNLTIGSTTKSVDWSDAVSFTAAEISGTASQTANGWMSSDDKIKLDSITVSDIGTVGANSIVGEKDINVSITDGIATIGHANTAVTAGTISGTSSTSSLAFGATVSLPSITYDAYGHITATSTTSFKLPAAPTSVSGNAGTATKFSSARTIALTGDVTGTASSNGESGWSIVTTVADNSHTHTADTIVPLRTKTYTGIIASADNEANGIFVYATVRPPTFADQWHIKYKMRAYVPNQPNYNQYSVIDLYGYKDTINYHIINTVSSYMCYSNHQVYKLKEAGFNNGYGHAIAARIWSASNPTNSSYARTFEFELLEEDNCAVTFLDNMTLYSGISGTGSTNYNSRVEYSYGNGLQETADANDINDRQLYFCGKTGSKGIWNGSFFMETGDGTYENICTAADGTVTTSNRTTATTKKANTTGFKVGSTIYYTNTSYNANANISGYAVVYNSYDIIDSRLSINSTLTANFLTPYKPMYLVGTIGSDGLFYLDDVWWTQTPTTAGKVYVLWGGCYDSSTSYCRITLYQHNPWFYHDGTKLVAYSDYVALADKANKDADGNVISSTYVKKSGDTMTGNLTVSNTSPVLTVKNTGTGAASIVLERNNNSYTNWRIMNEGGILHLQADYTTTHVNYYDALTIANNTGNATFKGTVTASAFSGNATSATTATNVATQGASSANDNRHVWFSAATETQRAHDDDFKYNPSTNTLTVANLAGNASSATKATQDGNGATISSTYAKLSGATFTGAVTGTSFGASSYLSANTGNSGTSGGLALYGTNPAAWGIAMRKTDNSGKHGYVQGDYATYFYMQGSNGTANDTYLTRGWIFRNNGLNEGVASISGHGNAVLRGSVTIGGNTANTSGMRMEYDATLKCTNFIFN